MNIKNTIKKNSKILYPIWHKIRLKNNELGEKKKVEAYQKYGHDALKKIMDMVVEKDYPCIVIFGTMLGLARDGKLIPWDDDVDFALVNVDKTIWNKLTKDMKQIGFKKVRQIEDDDVITSITYSWKNVLCDFDIWEIKDDPSTIFYYSNQIDGIEYKNNEYQDYKASYKKIPYFDKIIIEKFNGINVKVPKNYKDVVAAVYGENWRIPNKGYNTNYKKNIEGRIIKRKISSFR